MPWQRIFFPPGGIGIWQGPLLHCTALRSETGHQRQRPNESFDRDAFFGGHSPQVSLFHLQRPAGPFFSGDTEGLFIFQKFLRFFVTLNLLTHV
jgi:hypothetical protein